MYLCRDEICQPGPLLAWHPRFRFIHLERHPRRSSRIWNICGTYGNSHVNWTSTFKFDSTVISVAFLEELYTYDVCFVEILLGTTHLGASPCPQHAYTLDIDAETFGTKSIRFLCSVCSEQLAAKRFPM